MLQTLKKYKFLQFIFFIFLLLTIWWVYIQLFVDPSPENELRNMFTDTYGVVAGIAGIYGLTVYKKWGGTKSAMGRAILFFSLGLLAQWFGQLVYTFYFYFLKIEVPYPSLGDLGYFGSIPLYIFGAWNLARVSGSMLSLKTSVAKYYSFFWVLAVPAILLVISYGVFLKDISIDSENLLRTFLDFGYPIGQALYVSVAVLALILSNGFLGGLMKHRIMLVLFALFFQYFADFLFLYRNNSEQWLPGGMSDYLYLVAYFLMAVSLVEFYAVQEKLRRPQ